MKTISKTTLCVAVTSALASGLAHAQATQEKETTPEEILVVGQRIEVYRATDALTGTKTGAALLDLPLSLNVVPRQLIEDRGLTFLAEALDSVSGAQRKLGYGGTQNFGAFIRGFDTGFVTLRNGFRDLGFYTLRDTANVERYEVLKGPASVLYGTLQPGGITNTLTRQPVAIPLGRITAMAGSNQFYRTELDAGGPLAERVYYRANLALEDAGSFRDQVKSKSRFVAPVVSWLINEKTRWTGEVEYKHSAFTWDLGLLRNPVSFTLPTSRFLGEPDGINNVTSYLVSSVLEHQLNAAWQFRQKLQYAYTGGKYNLRSAYEIDTDGRSANRSAYATTESSKNISLQHELVGNLSAWGMTHQAIMGIEAYRNQQDYDFDYQSLASIDIFNPIYGAQAEDGFPLFGDDIKSDAVAFYAQDLMSVRNDLKLLAGVRYDDVNVKNYDRLEQKLVRKSNESAFSPQAGLVYQPSTTASVYASFSSSFFPIASGKKSDGAYLDPEKGQQFEVGVKQVLFGGKASATLAAYWITKQNVSTPDPANAIYRIQTGEQKSKGVEFDLTGTLMRGWDVVMTGAYNDAYVSRDNKIPVGSILPGAAKWSGSVWSKWTLSNGLALGLGAYRSTKRSASIPNPTWSLPAYTRFDAMASYTLDNLRLQLNLKNLTNQRIYDLSGVAMMPQAPRSLLLTASYTFR